MRLRWGLIMPLLIGVLCDAADMSYMRTTIEQHFSKSRHHTIDMAYKMAAAEFIHEEFKRYGLEIENQDIKDTTMSQHQFMNVIGVLKGNNFGTANDHLMGIGAHYDTVATSPGVDDNGSGVAAMLEVARQLTKDGIQRNNTLLFVSFDLEEIGLIGSQTFIEEWLNPWLSRNYGTAATSLPAYGIVVLDSLMEYNTSDQSQTFSGGVDELRGAFPNAARDIAADNNRGDFISVIYRQPAYTRDHYLASTFQRAWEGLTHPELEIVVFPLPSGDPQVIRTTFPAFLRSDHANFWRDNIPGVFITDSAEFRGDMMRCYHNPCDNLEVMLTDDNLRFLGKTADALAITLDELSEPITLHTSGIDGGWSDWSAWGTCTTTCGTSKKTRTRTCDSPVPLNGGADCVEQDMETDDCGVPPCSDTNGKPNVSSSVLVVIMACLFARYHEGWSRQHRG